MIEIKVHRQFEYDPIETFNFVKEESCIVMSHKIIEFLDKKKLTRVIFVFSIIGSEKNNYNKFCIREMSDIRNLEIMFIGRYKAMSKIVEKCIKLLLKKSV